MAKWKKRIDGSPAQIGQAYQEKARVQHAHARRKASGSVLAPQNRSVDSMKGQNSKMHTHWMVTPDGKYRERIEHEKSLKHTNVYAQRRHALETGAMESWLKKRNLKMLDANKDRYETEVIIPQVKRNKELEKPPKKLKRATEKIQDTPDFQAGYDKGLQEAALGKYVPHKSKTENWKKGYDAGWRKAFKDPKYDEIVLINTEDDLTAWEKRRAVMESQQFQTWMAERWHTHPIPRDPYVAFMIDKSLKAKLKERPEWAQTVNRADWEPVDYPPITKEAPPDIAVPSPKTVEAEKTKKRLRIHSKYLAEEMGVSEPTLHFTTSRGGRARSYYRSGYAINRLTGELVKVAEPEIVIGISGAEKISPENFATLNHEMGHHKQIVEMEKEKGKDAVLYHYKAINRTREARINCEREAWRNADPYMRKHRPAQKWLKKYAFGTYVGTTPGFRE